jgi:Domain of unknown function (DUF222)
MDTQKLEGEEDWEPPELDLDDDPELWPDPWDDPDTAMPAELEALSWAEFRQVLDRAEEISLAAVQEELLLGPAVAGAMAAERRGPGYSGLLAAGVYRSRTAGLARGGALDTARPCGTLAVLCEEAAGRDRSYAGASADEVLGAVGVWDRIRAWATGQMYAATAAFIRHRPADGYETGTAGGLPGVWDEHTGAELAHCLADSLRSTETMIETSYDLAGKLPGTMTALLDGDLTDTKARVIVRACANLDPAEAAQAEELVLDRAGRLTPGGLRAAIARAVMEVNPDAARQRREEAAKTRRVEVRAEESGNGQIAVRELDPVSAAAIDQELSARARELKKAGVGTGTDDRRVLAFLERFGLAPGLPGAGGPDGGGGGKDGSGGGDGSSGGNGGAGLGGGLVPAGVRGSLNLTVPARTVARLADRPGEAAGYGPIDPALAKDLAAAVLHGPAGNKVCVTVTDRAGHMTGHGCARTPTRTEKARWHLDQRRKHRRLTLTRIEDGPPGSDGTWLLDPGTGNPRLAVTIWPVTTDPCDHRLRAAGHDPGKELRHLVNLRYGHCSDPVCRRPAAQCDHEHDDAFEKAKLTCLCNDDPKCRRSHRLKQARGWTTVHNPDGSVTWTGPTGRQATTEPHQFPI